jgi:hypothetical protein
LDAENLPLHVKILGVNGVGFDSGNAGICQGRDIPWLQPTLLVDPWSLWGAGYRDLVILDEQNNLIEVFNLTVHDLRNQPEYDDLKARLRKAAGAP